MPTYYFVGGEDSDFQKIGGALGNTAWTAGRRTAYARSSLEIFGSTPTDGFMGALTSAQSTFWFTTRYYVLNQTGGSTGYDLIAFMDGTVRRLMLTTDGAGMPNTKLRLTKTDNAGTRTTLATATINMATNIVIKLDAQITYNASGNVKIYQDGLLIIDYTGDVTTNSATTLSHFVVGHGSVNTWYWSEIICTDADTRPLSLVTLPLLANGNTFSWTNSYTAIDEAITDDLDLIASGSVDQVAQTTVTSSGITGQPAILAVAVNARAMRGGTGPQNLQGSVRTASTDYFSSSTALTTTFAPVRNVWTTNPNTAAAWLYTDLTAAGFNIGVKSIT